MPVTYIEGDLLTTQADVYVHQISSMPCKAHGLSASIATSFPWADHYGQRTQMDGRNLATPDTRPACGSFQVSVNPNPAAAPRAVAGVVGQLDFGAPGYKRSRVPLYCDTASERLSWFAEGLHRVCEWASTEGYTTLALPYQVGCGLGGGKWVEYAAAIERTAEMYPRLEVVVVKRTSHT